MTSTPYKTHLVWMDIELTYFCLWHDMVPSYVIGPRPPSHAPQTPQQNDFCFAPMHRPDLPAPMVFV